MNVSSRLVQACSRAALRSSSKNTLSATTAAAARSITTYSQLPEEHQMIHEMCRRFADEELAPNAREWDAKHEFPQQAMEQLAELGLMGLNVKEESGGTGLDAMSYAIAMEEISRGCASVGVIMSAHNSLYLYPIQAFGNDAQQEEWVKPYAGSEGLKVSEKRQGCLTYLTLSSYVEDVECGFSNTHTSILSNKYLILRSAALD